jgi:recombination protein RecT
MSNDPLAKQKQDTLKFMESISTRKQSFQALLPKGMDAEWFMGEVKVAIARTPKLLECDRMSVFDSLTTCAQLGLSPSGRLGSAYLLPFGGKCTLVIGYKGYVDLAYRSGEVVGFGAQVVHEDDEFDYSEGFGVQIRHHKRSEEANPGALRYVYAWAEMRGGYKVAVLMLRREVLAIKDKAPGAKKTDSPWHTHEAEQWKKTALRRLIKLLPLSPQKAQGLHRAQEVEDAEWVEAAEQEAEEKAPARGTARLKALAAGSRGETLESSPVPDSAPASPPEPGSDG